LGSTGWLVGVFVLAYDLQRSAKERSWGLSQLACGFGFLLRFYIPAAVRH
jgi:hypothetical protein